jgi:undecaprenyl-diphosphatase
MTLPTRSKRRLVITAIACGIGFLIIGLLASSNWLTGIETGWVKTVAGSRSPAVTSFMQGVTWLGTAWFELPFVLIVVGWLWYRRRPGEGIRYFVWGLGGWAMYAVLKVAFHRARPKGIPRLSGAGWHSFPSGHAMLAPILFVFAAALVTAEPRLQRFRVPALALTWLVSCLLALSRVYLGVHYPSDVIAGLLAGSAWLALSLAFTAPQPETKMID